MIYKKKNMQFEIFHRVDIDGIPNAWWMRSSNGHAVGINWYHFNLMLQISRPEDRLISYVPGFVI